MAALWQEAGPAGPAGPAGWVLDTGTVIYYVRPAGRCGSLWQVYTGFGPGSVLQTDGQAFATVGEAKRHAEGRS